MLKYNQGIEKKEGCGPLLDRDRSNSAPIRQQIFHHVRAHGQAARSDIARALQISPGSVTTQTAELIAAGQLREVEDAVAVAETGRGRPRVALEVVPDAHLVIGIKMSLKRHSAMLCDFAGNTLGTAVLPASEKRRTLSELLDEVMRLIDDLLQTTGKSAREIKAVGLGLPGLVDHALGTITWSSMLADTHVDLAGAFNARFPAPLILDNDTNMLTLAELWFGKGRERSDFVVVTIENGVGMGLVVNNALYRGAHGMGLELGHTKVQLDGALCRCGQRGCLEAYLGDYALTREASTALGQGGLAANDPEELLDHLFEKAKAGNSAAETIFRRAGRYLSVGLANVVQLFDPPLIIITGERMQYDYLFGDEVMSEMQRLTLSDGRAPCDIQIHPWDDLVWARGATAAALSVLTDRVVGGAEVPLQ